MWLINLIPAPYRLAAGAAVAVAALVGAFAAGVRWEGNARDAADLKRAEAVRIEEARLADIAYSLGMALAEQHAQAETDRQAWDKERRGYRGSLVKIDCGAGLQAPAAGAAAVRFDADFVRLYDAGLCIGAEGDCDGGADAALPPAAAPGRAGE